MKTKITAATLARIAQQLDDVAAHLEACGCEDLMEQLDAATDAIEDVQASIVAL